ncbi:hypothetical protein T261_5711 [Streptomyces lydicus]|nr:hypothetical protein T261_5711 [Streptomyces lydicus]
MAFAGEAVPRGRTGRLQAFGAMAGADADGGASVPASTALPPIAQG